MVDQRLLPHNPADHVAPLKVAHKSMTILNEEQLDAFLTAVKQDAVRKAFFYTELTTSLRPTPYGSFPTHPNQKHL